MSAEACADRRAALAAAAIDRLDEHEMLALQAHLDGCAARRAELVELRSVARLVAAVDVDHVHYATAADDGAPATLGERIVLSVHDARNERSGRRTRRRVGTIALGVVGIAAAIAIAIAVALGNVPANQHTARRTFVLHGTNASARATIREAADGTDVRFRGRVSDVGGGNDPYWLWLTDSSGNRLAAATFRDRADGSFSIIGHGAIAFRDVKRVWVTDVHRRVVLDTAVPKPS